VIKTISAAMVIVAVATACGRPEEHTVIVQMAPSTLGTPIDRDVPARLETATFAVG